MKQLLFKTFSLTYFLIHVSLVAFSQNGSLSGKIIDKSTGEEIIGAVVKIEGTNTATTSDLSGNYVLKVPVGTHTISCNFISYRKVIINNLVVKEGENIVLDFTLESDNVEIKEVVIEAVQQRNTDASLISIQKKSFAVQDGVSAQQMARTGSNNAAESMKQMTGANVEDGKFMVMRGLGDRYSIAQLNGLPIPSSDPYRNASSLDLIPSSFVDNIVTTKTFTPDQPGNFAGGNLNITTKSFPEKPYLNVSVSQSFNTLSSLNSDFLTYQGGTNDWRGVDDGTRKVPDLVLNDSVRDLLNSSLYLSARNKSEVNSAKRELFNNSAKAFSNVFIAEKAGEMNNESGFNYQLKQVFGLNNNYQRTPLNNNYSFSAGKSIAWKNIEIGMTAGGNYQRNFTHYTDGEINTYINTNSEKLFAYQALKETKSIDNPQLGGLANVAIKIAKKHSIGVTGIYSNDAEKVSRQQTGSFMGQVSDSRAQFNTNVLEFTQRELKNIVLNGSHSFNVLHGLDIDWSASNTQTRQYEPDLRYFAYTSVRDTADSVAADGSLVRYLDTAYYMNNAEFAFPYHFYRDLRDQQQQAKIDFTLNVNKSQSFKIKWGGYFSDTKRNFEEYRFQMNNTGIQSSQKLLLDNFNGDLIAFLNSDNFGITDTLYTAAGAVSRYSTGWHYINQVNNRNFYTGSQNIAAAYAMTVFSPFKNFKVITGARVESTDLNVVSRDTNAIFYSINGDSITDPGKLKLVDLLPSINTVYALTENSNIRLAYSQTIARPNMRELAPFEQFDTKNGFFNVGNPGLKRTLINNFDIRYELYTRPGEIIAVSAYYKTFKDPIIRAFNPKATIPELSFVNVDKAEVLGAEFEFRKSLDFISPFLHHFYLNTNLTLIKSRVDIPTQEIENSKNVDSTYNLANRPFQGQAPYIINAILTYANPKIGHESSLSFNVSGAKLYSISLFATPDVYEAPVPFLNFKTTQNIGKYWQISFTMRNLLNAMVRKTQVYKGQTYFAETFQIGRTFGLGVSFRIK
ncbi:MAG: TonB-dependent receptor domain-containing protein [Bacteroidota bacterium]